MLETYDISFALCRFLLLNTLPVLLGSLIILVLSNVINMGTVLHATLSTVSVVVYFCCFVMGFGPIPNILCSEIFPTRVRGLCIAICSLTFWFGDIIVTYSLPALLSSIGLAGVFGIYAVVCSIARFLFTSRYLKQRACPLKLSASSSTWVPDKPMLRKICNLVANLYNIDFIHLLGKKEEMSLPYLRS